MLRYTEVKDKSAKEVYEILGDLKKKQFMLRFQARSGILKGTSGIRECRRDIARLNTRLTELKG